MTDRCPKYEPDALAKFGAAEDENCQTCVHKEDPFCGPVDGSWGPPRATPRKLIDQARETIRLMQDAPTGTAKAPGEFPKCKDCKGAGGTGILLGCNPLSSRCPTCYGSGVDLDATHRLFMAREVQLTRVVSAVAHLYDYLNELPDTCAIGRAADILNVLSDTRKPLAVVDGYFDGGNAWATSSDSDGYSNYNAQLRIYGSPKSGKPVTVVILDDERTGL